MILRHAGAILRPVFFLLCMLPVVCPVVDAMAQTAALTVGSASGSSGTTISVSVDLDPGAASIHTLQFDLMFSPALSFVSASTGAAASAAGKSVEANAFTGRARILVFAANRSSIGPGRIANVQFGISGNSPAGAIPLVISGIVAADSLAEQVYVSGASGAVTVFPGAGAVPPNISAVAVSDVTSKSVRISWTTDRPSDSEVEYWTADSAIHRAVLTMPVTRHALELNHLQPMTTYHFHVKSADPGGNRGISSEQTFTTAENGSIALVMARPALELEREMAADEIMAGIALANLDTKRADVTYTAIKSDGILLEGQNIANPSIRQLNPETQLAILDLEVFGEGFLTSGSNAWIKLESTNAATYGFFLVFDSDLNFMDGSNLSDSPLTDFAFIEVQKDGHNRISIANNNPEIAELTLDLIGTDGTTRSSESRVIAANGALVADLFGDLFSGVEPDVGTYVRIGSSRGVHPFQIMQPYFGDVSALAGQDLSGVGTTLYSPQYVLGGAYHTSVSLINLDSRDGTVQLRFVGEDGRQIGATRYLSIAGNGKLHIDDQAFFLPAWSEDMVVGYVEIISDGVRIAGSTVFADRNGDSFSAALALIADLQKSVIFSHVASDDLYFTGIAILNPGSEDVNLRLELYAEDGALIEAISERIPAGQRKARLLSECFGYLAKNSLTSGYVRLTSDRPVASFSLFGTHDLSILSAIPPQAIGP